MAIEKTKFIGVRISPEGLRKIKQKAKKASVSPSRYVREVALGERAQDEDELDQFDKIEALREMRASIDAIGKNINQIARVGNQTGQIKLERITEANQQLIAMKRAVIGELS